LNLIQKGHRHTHRGIIGIESAIVLIAFVIVAAALAFVVLNMGFSTTQKAKTAIIAAVEEAGSSLEVAGKITAAGWVQQDALNATNIPLKIVSGGATSNLDGNFTSVKYISDFVEYDNVYINGTIHHGSFVNASMAWDRAVAKGWLTVEQHPYSGNFALNPTQNTETPPNTIAIIYFTVNQNNNTIIDIGEHAVLSVAFSSKDRPHSLDHIAWEVSTPKGAPMTVDRTIPNISTEIVDLG
jgi:archaeal flagellin FlaB